MGLGWADLVGSTWDIYGLSGLGLGVDRPGGFHMGYIWAKSAWARTGQPHMGSVLVLYGLSGQGLDLVNHSWVLYRCCMGSVGRGYNWSTTSGSRNSFIWDKWAWAWGGQTWLVPHGIYIWAKWTLAWS